jgi:DNA end-binding protein Ku
MQQLLYADEVRPISEVPVGDAEIKEGELKLAVQLVEQIASDEFRPENYTDDVKKRYQEAIQKKIEGHEITAAPEAPKAQIIDLMEALKASLAAKGGAAPAPPARAAEAEEDAEKATGTEGRGSKRTLRLASGPKRKSKR